VTELTIDTVFEKDGPKLVGEAVNPDGTLKDASEMRWVNSPSDETPPPPERGGIEHGTLEKEGPALKKRCVSHF
jgi:hypothetical protein